MRRAAKKAATKIGKCGQMDAQTIVQLPEFSVSMTSASTSLSMPQSLDVLPVPCNIAVEDAICALGCDIQIDDVNNCNQNNDNDDDDRATAYTVIGNDVAHPPNVSDSDSDKDENDEDEDEIAQNDNGNCTNDLNHTIAAAVPVEDETDRNTLIDILQSNSSADLSDNSIKKRSTGKGNDYHILSMSMHSSLSSSESQKKLEYKEDNHPHDVQTSNPLSRKRNRPTKDK